MRSGMMTATALALLIGAAAPATHAQSDESPETAAQDFVDARAALGAAQEQIIRDEMIFTVAEADRFWPAYEAYREDLAEVRGRRAGIIEAYLRAYWDGNVTDKMAKDLVEDHLAIEQEILKVRRKHLKKFRKILPPRKVGRFYQLEIKFDADIDAQLALSVPLMETL